MSVKFNHRYARGRKSSVIILSLPLFFLFCVKVPYNVEKFHTVKLFYKFQCENFNEFFSSRTFHEIYHNYCDWLRTQRRKHGWRAGVRLLLRVRCSLTVVRRSPVTNPSTTTVYTMLARKSYAISFVRHGNFKQQTIASSNAMHTLTIDLKDTRRLP